ncbi:MAG: MFS transporter [Hominisplanchenecus sp.]
MKLKLTRQEKAWILYDVGNSAFVLMVATIVPIYFNYLAGLSNISQVDYLAYWGYAASAATLIVAMIGPVFGTLADTRNFKKPIFIVSIAVGAIGCAVLGLIQSWFAFLAVFVIAKVGYSSSLVFYDSMLTDISDEERLDAVSAQGYAWGYIGSCIPFVVSLVFVLGAEQFGFTMNRAMMIAFLITAAWWVIMSLPLLNNYHQKHYVEVNGQVFKRSFGRLFDTLKNIKKEKKVFLFLVAFFFYIDGVYTIIEMATAYGQALGLDSTGLLGALLLTQIVAFPCSILFGRLAHKYHPEKLITICIMAYSGIAVFGLFLNTQWQFWVLAVCVGMFQGGIQALSRSYFARIIPAEKSGEYFGILDICGKGASFLGTTLVGAVSQITGSVNVGVGALILLFLAGLIVFGMAARIPLTNSRE